MTLPAKITVGILGMAVSTSAVGGYELLRSKSIEEILKKEGDIVLNTEKTYTSSSDQTQTEDYKNWKEIVDQHKSSDSEIKSFTGWNGETQEHEKINKLINKCKEILKIFEKSENFDTNKSNAKKFCTKKKVTAES